MDAPRIIARMVEIVASPKSPKRSVPDGLLLEFDCLMGKPALPQDGLPDPYVARRRQSNLRPDPWSGLKAQPYRVFNAAIRIVATREIGATPQRIFAASRCHRFRVDVSEPKEASGVVEEIGMLSTRVRTAEGHFVYITNAKFADLTITNHAPLDKTDRVASGPADAEPNAA